MATGIGRRQFISALGGGVACPLVASAQQLKPLRRIGVLMALTEGDAEGQARLRAIREGLEKFGWSDGQNVQIDARWAAGSIDQLRSTVTELVRQKPDVIVERNEPSARTQAP